MNWKNNWVKARIILGSIWSIALIYKWISTSLYYKHHLSSPMPVHESRMIIVGYIGVLLVGWIVILLITIFFEWLITKGFKSK